MNPTITKLERQNRALLAALKDLATYTESHGAQEGGGLTRAAERALRKARPILAREKQTDD